ncbi:DUF2207 domain-containing protein [Chryseomicrobium palamuruense]|uniref:DUF2207 domain-containing protein n=1 Tax=Chryseomicrobium palamuruense TaxID=682973 RepID=A0ABV8UZS2_9BACL
MAIDFEISDVDIDARLQENGTANVTETFTYVFDDDFNGITRSLIEKQGTSIENFAASENGNTLRTERVDGVYRIYRAGEDGDTITVNLTYTITDAVEKFTDGAQFYYAFFDENNESAYDDATITVTPPGISSNTDALGYDEAFGSERISSNGAVVFELGAVPDGENADVRVIFDADLFPAVTQASDTVRDKVASDRTQLEEEAAVFAANQQTARDIGVPVVALAGALLIALIFQSWLKAFFRKRALRTSGQGFIVPQETMSIPATLYFTNSAFLSPSVTAAAILDLIRKGNLHQVTEDQFELVNRTTTHAHEETLLALLVDRIGNGQEFTLTQVKEFTKKIIYHSEYNMAISEWNKGVRTEVLSHNFYEKHPVIRWLAGIAAAAFIGFAIYLGIYEIWSWMSASIIFAFAAFGFALLYSPISREGHEIRSEWRHLKKTIPTITEDQWKALSEDERQRAYAYILGSDAKLAEKKAEVFTVTHTTSEDSSFIMNPIFLTTIFISAGSTTSASASGGSVGGGGAGVGGGGGGSGAF